MVESKDALVEVKQGEDKSTQSANKALQSESESLRKTTPANDTRIESNEKIIPSLEIVEEKKEIPLSQEEKTRVSFLQQQVINIFAISQPRPENMSDEQYKKHVEEGIEKVQKEQQEGKFGPATQEAYKNMVIWLEKQAVPGAITELTRLQLPLPAGTPLDLPKDQQDRVVSVDYYKQLVASGKINPDLKLDPEKIPSGENIEKLDDTMRWLKEVDTTALTARQEQQDRLLEKEIKRLIPDEVQRKAWLDRKNSDPQEWRSAAIEAVDLATRVRNYTEAMDSLNRAGKRFDFAQPPGAEIVRDEKGRITQVKLDLPKDLRLGHPENERKMENLRKWMADHGEEVDQALKELIKLEEEPDRLLFWGDIDMPDGRVRLDNKGNISEFVDKEKVDGSESYYNLVGLEFEAEEVTGQDGKPKIRITNDVQYKYSNWYNYLNIGADHIGNEVSVQPREYDPEDWVPVRNGGKVEIMKAKDLADWRTRQQVFYYGEKALIATLDTAMLVTGTIQVGAAVKAARAGQLVLSQAVKQGLKGGLRATVGASGIVNNSYFQNTEYGQNIQMARGLYFVGDAALGLGTGSWRMAKNLRGGVEAAKAGESAASIVEAQIKASKWANKLYAPAEFGAKMTELPFAVVIGMDIYHQLDGMSEIGRNDPTRAAMRQAKDGRGDQAPEVKETPIIVDDKAKVAELDRYNNLLSIDGQDPKVKEIIEKTKSLIEGDATDAEKSQYKEELMDNFMPNGKDIDSREKDNSYKADKTRRHLGYAEGQSRAVQTAAALAFLQLARNEDGSLPETLATRTIEIGDYQYKVKVSDDYGGYSEEEKTQPARSETQELKRDDITAFLQRELESPKEESRLVASTDLALQLGVVNGREVAGVLQDVITSNKSSAIEKSEAVLRLGVTIDALKIQEAVKLNAEEQFKDDSKRVGLSSKAIEAYLKNVSLNADDADLRATAGLMGFANSESDSEVRKQLIKSFSDSIANNSDKPGQFAQEAIELLKSNMSGEANSPERKLNAASITLDLIKAEDNPQLKQLAYETIAGCVNENNVALSTRALEYLTPEGITLLSEKNPRLAAQVRDTSVEIIRDTVKAVKEYTLTTKTESERVAFIKALKPVIEGGDQLQRSTVEQSLISFIDQKSASFADFSPALRIASIQALTDLGSRNSIATLTETLAGDQSKNLLRDWDPKVRHEALKALETLKDPKLRSLVLSLVHTETDPTVSALLSDVRFTQQRLDPTSEEYKKEFERTSANLMRDPFEGWDSLKKKVETFKTSLPQDKQSQATELYIRQFREKNYPLLDGVEFNRYRDAEGEKAAKAVYAGFGGSIDWFFSYQSTVDREEAKARNSRRDEITNARNNQFEGLIDKAALKTEDGMVAKMVLVDILLNGGQPFSNGESPWAQGKAADAIYDLAKPGVENRDYIVWAVESGLTNSRNMDQAARRRLHQALDQLATPDKNKNRAITREEAAMTAARALDLQNTQRAPYSADPVLQSGLVDTIMANGHHKIYPVLEALAENRKGTALGQKAETALFKMRDSVVQVWRDTAKDTTTTPAQRAINIENALKDDSNNSQQLIETIFAAAKQSYTKDINDPRIQALKMAMNSTNERVRLAAAGSLIEMASHSGLDLSAAVRVLSDIEKNSQVTGFKDDARLYINLTKPVAAK